MKKTYTYMVMAAVVVSLVGGNATVLAKEAVSQEYNYTVAVVKNNDQNNTLHVEDKVTRVERENVEDRVAHVEDELQERVEVADREREGVAAQMGVALPERNREVTASHDLGTKESSARPSRGELMAGRGMAANNAGAPNGYGGRTYTKETFNESGELIKQVTTKKDAFGQTREVTTEVYAQDGTHTKHEYYNENGQLHNGTYRMTDPNGVEYICDGATNHCLTVEEANQKKEEEERQRREAEARERERCERTPNAAGCEPPAQEERCIDEAGDCEEGNGMGLFMELCGLSQGMNCDLGEDMRALLGMAGGACDERNGQDCGEARQVSQDQMQEEMGYAGDACNNEANEDCHGEGEAAPLDPTMLCMDQDCGNVVGEMNGLEAALAAMGQNENDAQTDDEPTVSVEVEVEVEVEGVEEETEELPENVGGNA